VWVWVAGCGERMRVGLTDLGFTVTRGRMWVCVGVDVGGCVWRGGVMFGCWKVTHGLRLHRYLVTALCLILGLQE
jgi:hypothetical protein